LEEQLRESEEREAVTRQMYDKMFSAFDSNDPNWNLTGSSAKQNNRREETFNSTHISFGREME
jgi:hypothetical protein